MMRIATLTSMIAFAKPGDGSPGASTVPPVTVPPAPEGTLPVTAPVTATTGPKRVPPVIGAIRTDIPIPAKSIVTGRTGMSLYPFDKLEIGQSFGVNKTAKEIASTVSSANKRNRIERKDANGVTVMVKTDIKDANGVVTSTVNTPEMVPAKMFAVYAVDPKTDPDNATARIFRIALPSPAGN